MHRKADFLSRKPADDGAKEVVSLNELQELEEDEPEAEQQEREREASPGEGRHGAPKKEKKKGAPTPGDGVLEELVLGESFAGALRASGEEGVGGEEREVGRRRRGRG